METKRIIEVYKMQSTPLSNAINKDEWFNVLKIKLNRTHIIQVLRELKHLDGVIPPQNLDSYFDNCRWSDLISMLDCALNIESDSYLNTIN